MQVEHAVVSYVLHIFPLVNTKPCLGVGNPSGSTSLNAVTLVYALACNYIQLTVQTTLQLALLAS